MSLEELTKQLGESRVLLAQIAPEMRNSSSKHKNSGSGAYFDSRTGSSATIAAAAASASLLQKARAGIVEIIESKKIVRGGKVVILNSPTSADYSNPVLSAVYLVIRRTSNYFLLYEATKNVQLHTLESFFRLLQKEKLLRAIFKKMVVFPRIFSKDGGTTFIDFKGSIENVDRRIKIFKYAEKERRDSELLALEQMQKDAAPTNKRKASLTDALASFKLGPNSPFTTTTSQKKFDDKSCIIKTNGNWNHIPFDDLLVSGKTLITPFETTISPTTTTSKIKDHYYVGDAGHRSDSSIEGSPKPTSRRNRLKVGFSHIRRLSENIPEINGLRKINIFRHRKTVSTPEPPGDISTLSRSLDRNHNER
ncbi:hypothetical protein AYI68_g3503 [Smittium mucronatum]|uniref:Uncharacterized protein n=1 Tax=Smittium mucronatum TaxID=133383 RepID=A0A1R0GZN7_9FUNG|nr:hypothetical protein AYI68_g3836 [Smittium mucronatum]OLY82373.1 hypothetical protein AYI68_g3503 [Smittium mucronatum]